MKYSSTGTSLPLLNPETAHNAALAALRAAGALPGGKWLLSKRYALRSPDLEREVFGMRFPNPVGVAAGYDPDGDTIEELSAAGFGFIEIGAVTPRPQPGSPRPRIFSIKSDNAILDRSGYPNKGLEYAMGNVRNRHKGIIVGCNIAKNNITSDEAAAGDYLKVFRNMYQYVDYFTVNVACNTTAKSYVLSGRERIEELLAPLFEFRRGQLDYRPILLKISPDLTHEELDEIVTALIELRLDGIVAVAGTLSRDGLDRGREYADARGEGAISGAPLTERAIAAVRYIHEKSGGVYPIVGSGGMMTPDDVRRMLDAGASLVQLNTGIRYGGLGILKRICRHLLDDAAKRQKEQPDAQHDNR